MNDEEICTCDSKGIRYRCPLHDPELQDPVYLRRELDRERAHVFAIGGAVLDEIRNPCTSKPVGAPGSIMRQAHELGLELRELRTIGIAGRSVQIERMSEEKSTAQKWRLEWRDRYAPREPLSFLSGGSKKTWPDRSREWRLLLDGVTKTILATSLSGAVLELGTKVERDCLAQIILLFTPENKCSLLTVVPYAPSALGADGWHWYRDAERRDSHR